jgi:alanine dehydrogenase
MKIIIPKETTSEPRVSMLPQNVEKLIKKGAKITIESGLGISLVFRMKIIRKLVHR